MFSVNNFQNYSVCKPFYAFIDKYKLLKSNQKIDKSQYACYLNLALLKQAYEKTHDPITKRKIEFLANNYLDKAAQTTLYDFQEAKHLFQLGFFNKKSSYHRQCVEGIKYGDKINKDLAFANPFSPLILTDTDQFQHLLPLKFSVINEKNKDQWVQIIYDWGLKILKNQKEMIVCDFSESLKDPIKTYGDMQLEAEFMTKLINISKELIPAVEEAVNKLQKDGKIKFKNDLLMLFSCNTMCITACNFENNLAGIKILSNHPVDPSPLLTFLTETGLFVGIVNMRRHVFDSMDSHDVEYAITKNDSPYYFNNRVDFLNTQLFKRVSNKLKNDFMDKPHIQILGQATIDLLEGLLKNEISDEQWKSLHSDPARKEVIQTALFKIHHLLAAAELKVEDFTEFALSIELIHAEMAALLEFMAPYKPEQFAEIYSPQVNLPESLKPQASVKIGLGKTGVNTFAGICAAIAADNPSPVRLYGKDFYYEEADFIGKDQTLEKVMSDASIKKVDLYACVFNPNVDTDPKQTNYSKPTVEQDIRRILNEKPDTKKLTVAVDFTIDYANSEKVTKLLASFAEEIKQGKLNFVFFRSGQKFDMLGMDNYYGAPYFIVNNGSKDWDSFNLLKEEAHQTDSLSLQWFCLANRYIPKLMDEYRKIIFSNTREILNHIPPSLKSNSNSQKVRVNSIDQNVDPCFIDMKLANRSVVDKVVDSFFNKCMEKGIKHHMKGSFGFYHANILSILTQGLREATTRINPGLNPAENAVLIEFFEEIAKI